MTLSQQHRLSSIEWKDDCECLVENVEGSSTGIFHGINPTFFWTD